MPSFPLTALAWFAQTAVHILFLIVGLLLLVALTVYADRKIFAGVQMRKGPNVVGPFGLLQSFADLFKFLLKELTIPSAANRGLFVLAPLLSATVAFIGWAVMPLAPHWVVSNLNVGVIYLLGASSMGVYGVIMGGWASNSKYAFLGALRSASQMISYEVAMGLVLVTVILLSGTMNLTSIVEQQAGGFWRWNLFGGGHGLVLTAAMAPMAIVFFVATLAETNRPPFDLPEAESELVAGYAVEYGSSLYMLFYLAETANIILLSALTATLFLGGWQAPFALPGPAHWPSSMQSVVGLFWLLTKTASVFFLNAMVRAVTPRYRYDQLMRLGWKVFLPAALCAVVVVAAYRVLFE